jgi:hypothetical protein
MFFADLTPYEYGRAIANSDVLNVGWLSRDFPFQTGATSALFAERLEQLIQDPVNLYRGIHCCAFCPPPPKAVTPKGLNIIEPIPGTYGNGEIRVRGVGQIVYVAPVLVLHYVTKHGYLPPIEFVRAVEATS